MTARVWLLVACVAGAALAPAALSEPLALAAPPQRSAAAAACEEGDRRLAVRDVDGAREKYALARRLADGSSDRARDVAAAELRLANVAMIRGDLAEARRRLGLAQRSAEELRGEARFQLAAVLDAQAAVDVRERDFAAAERHLGDALRVADEAVPRADPRRLTPRLALARFHLAQGRPRAALGFARAATELAEGAFGATDRRLLEPLLLQGRAEAVEAGAAADATFERALRVAAPIDPRDPELGFALGAAGMHFASRGRFELLERAVALQEARGGGEDVSLLSLLGALANAHQATGKTKEAGALLDRSLRILERAAGPDSPELARLLSQRARVHLAVGELAPATQQLTRAVRLVERRPGLEDALVDALVALAEARRLGGDLEQARAAIDRGLVLARQPALAARADQTLRLQILGSALLQVGDPRAARPVLEEAVRAAEALGPDRAEVGLAVASLAGALLQLEEPAAAEAALRRALANQIAHEGELGPSVGGTHKSLARARLAQGDRDGALVAVRRAIQVLSQGPDVHGSALVLAQAHVELGALSPVEEAAREAELAQAILVKKFGPNTSKLSQVDLLLAGVAAGRGDVAGAEQHAARALARLESEVGSQHAELVAPLSALAEHAVSRRDFRRAFELLGRADELASRAPGDTHSWTVRLQLVKAVSGLERHREALELAQRVAADMERRLGPDHPALADALALVVGLEAVTGQGDPAAHLRRVREIRVKVLGANAPSLAPLGLMEGILAARRGATREGDALLARAAQDLRDSPSATKELALVETVRAVLAADRGDAAAAVELAERAVEHSETDLGLVLGRSNDRESDELVFERVLAHRVAIAVHLGYAPNDARAARAAITGALRMKERSREAAALAMASARRRMAPGDQTLLDALGQARSDAARLDSARVPQAARPAHATRVADAWQRVFGLERELASRGNVPSELTARVTLDEVRAGLAPGCALVELVAYDAWRKGRPLDGDDDHRYAAYVLRAGAEPIGVDLGPADALDRDVAALRAALGGEGEGAHTAIAARLYAKLIRPLEPALRGVTGIVIAPEGSLAMLPFAALTDESAHTLLERYTLSFVGTGRELAHRPHVPARGPAVVLADPAFGEPPRAGAAGSRFFFGPLPGTAAEAKVLATLLPDARILTGAAAREAAVKAVAGPRILHIATHGFFLGEAGDTRGTRGLQLVTEAGAKVGSGSAMTRSGLGFAGANARDDAAEDGVLSALEASGLDLAGTKLVVLSACQTGLGDPKIGHGVYGLRRAFAIAGAETQVLSLWKVSDEVTATLMGHFYRALVGGAGRAEGLRAAQLAVARDRRTTHPYFWAGFVLSGDVTTLEGAAPPPATRVGQVGPSARGCACDTAPGAPDAPLPWAIALGLSGAVLARVRARARARLTP